MNLRSPRSTTRQLTINGERMRADFEELSLIGLSPSGGINRLALSPEDLRARQWLADRIEEAGLIVRDDDAANLSGVFLSPDPQARTLLVGSHLDSVPNGGRFDGTIGVLAGLECLRTLRESGFQPALHLEVINFTDDEGCWKSMFGSRALTGLIEPEDISDVRVDNGPFRAALTRAGIDPRAVFRARRDPKSIAGYLELHIEQGTRLERAGVSIGVVTGVVGRMNYRICFHGQAAHSGTTDMYKRRDALRGAALFIVRAHDAVRARYGDGIFNCGDVEVKPGAFNIIPSEACLNIECRHVSETLMNEMETAIIGIARECAASYDLTVTMEPIARIPAASMAPEMIEAIERSASELNLTHMRLISYAGHAAQVMSRFTPSGMIFVPSVGGVGHRPEEFTEWDDVVNGANVLLQTILKLAAPTPD